MTKNEWGRVLYYSGRPRSWHIFGKEGRALCGRKLDVRMKRPGPGDDKSCESCLRIYEGRSHVSRIVNGQVRRETGAG